MIHLSRLEAAPTNSCSHVFIIYLSGYLWERLPAAMEKITVVKGRQAQ